MGVACGAYEMKMCDVLVSTQVVKYDQGRAEDGGFIPRRQAINASPYLISLFSEINRWPSQSIKSRVNESNVPIPEIQPGVIVSGPYLIDDPEMKKLFIQSFAHEAVGIEMECSHLFQAMQQTATHNYYYNKGSVRLWRWEEE